MLTHLEWRNVGIIPELDFEFAPNLNLITGDNGLGKTMLLDVAWYILTNTWPASWPGKGVVPTLLKAEIDWRENYEMNGSFRRDDFCGSAEYDYQGGRWKQTRNLVPNDEEFPGSIVIYARVDGGFSVYDPFRKGQDYVLPFGAQALGISNTFQFDAVNTWDGLTVQRQATTIRACEGLLRDWMNWARMPEESSFQQFVSIVSALAPHETWEPLPKAIRVFQDDVRDIPVLRSPIGEIPIVHAPASVKRIVSFAYILVWAWREHKIAASLKKQAPSSSMVLLFDEVDAHLHPQWQRRIAPAIAHVGKALEGEVHVQSLMTTHSPLVLASLEPNFDLSNDAVFHLEQVDNQAQLRKIPWAKQGDVSNWLVSDSFGLEQGRSVEAENVIHDAQLWMRGGNPTSFPSKEAIQKELERVLADHDPFWPRWIVWVEKQQGKTGT
jgi:hypothetical protein